MVFVANRSQLSPQRRQLDHGERGAPAQSVGATGNRLGQLWAILPLETPARAVEPNKVNARIERSINLERFPNPYTIDTFAFANWGGDFFIFVRQTAWAGRPRSCACRVEMGRCRSKPKTPT